MQALRAVIDRLRALPPRRFDAALAGLLLVEAGVEVTALVDLRGADLALTLLTLGGMAFAIAFRRVVPVTAMATQFAGLIALEQIGQRALLDNLAGPFFWMLLAVYTVGWRTEGPRLYAGAAIGTALIVAGTALDSYADDVPSFVNAVALTIAVPLLLAQLLRNRSRLNQALRAKAQRLERERAMAAEAAALQERTRIAGDLHDVVAHALSAMTVQATAARRMAERDPAKAETAFATVEATGREALTELRRLLGVLRREHEELALAPQPSLAHVGSLVKRAQAAGLPVELTLEGEPVPLPAGVDLTAYRVIQEALGRARDGGGAGRASVTVRYAPAEVQVVVADDGGPSGRRLLGLRERVAVYGGQMQVAAPDAGGWRVAARLPVERGA